VRSTFSASDQQCGQDDRWQASCRHVSVSCAGALHGRVAAWPTRLLQDNIRRQPSIHHTTIWCGWAGRLLVVGRGGGPATTSAHVFFYVFAVDKIGPDSGPSFRFKKVAPYRGGPRCGINSWRRFLALVFGPRRGPVSHGRPACGVAHGLHARKWCGAVQMPGGRYSLCSSALRCVGQRFGA
jgi:hypothetical protein